MEKRTIIWDFNGTLLNDMQVCIDCMNIMLQERSLPSIDLEYYRTVFTFPVREYYLSLGFDFQREDFEVPAHQFIELYRENLHLAPLHAGVTDILEHFRRKGMAQVILSAMEQGFLEETLRSKGIMDYFHRVAGIRDHLAGGKLEIARELVSELDGNPGNLFLIGDTLHDFEVAEQTGVKCILVAGGHQSFERLSNSGCTVLHGLDQVKKIFDENN